MAGIYPTFYEWRDKFVLPPRNTESLKTQGSGNRGQGPKILVEFIRKISTRGNNDFLQNVNINFCSKFSHF